MSNLFNKCKVLSIFFILTGAFNTAFAVEGFANQPGTRALGLAGAFTALADDASAIWYNPAALAHYDFIESDFTIELGQRIISQDENSSNNSITTESLLKYAAVYTRNPLILNKKLPIGIGASYFSPYKMKIEIDAPQSALTDRIFGEIDATYHQVSSMINYSVSPKLSLGGTIDFIWLNINCFAYSPCVDKGPTGFGATFSGLYELIRNKDYTIRIGANWRSTAKLYYRNTPSSGIGTVLTDYIPDRPDTKNIGISLQYPTFWALINTNLILENVSWSSSNKRGKPLYDYQNIGSSIELLSVTQSGKSYAIRFGSKLLNNKTTGIYEYAIATFGAGYEFKKGHLIDIAYEYKKLRKIDINTNTWSISYSWQ